MSRKRGKRQRAYRLPGALWPLTREPLNLDPHLWRRDFDWAWVTERVATGGMPLTTAELDVLVQAGITHIANVADELAGEWLDVMEADGRFEILHNPTPDDGRWKGEEWFGPTVDFAIEGIERGGRVLVHCLSGSNRGPCSALAVLLALGQPYSHAEALVRAARPTAQLRYRTDARAAMGGAG